MTDLQQIAGTADGLREDRRAAALRFAAGRKISARTLERLGVVAATEFFPDLGRHLDALRFVYANGWKARALEQKTFVAKKGFKPSFWGLEEVLRARPDVVYITEGELDRCAMVEAGIPLEQVLSVPNGAKEKPTEGEPDIERTYGFVKEALEAGLRTVKKFVWCGDVDGPGRLLRSDMAYLLGMARFWFVDWPDGCKDANDLLMHAGSVALAEHVRGRALPWPINGIYRLSELPEPPPLQTWLPGFDEWESKVRLAPRTMSVVTGHPGHGKTQLWTQIWYNVTSFHGVPVAVASFETRAKPHMRRYLRTLFNPRHKHETEMDAAELRAADAFIEDHYLFMSHPDNRPTLKWFLDMAEVAVIRHGARVVQIDPWNRLEASRGRDQSETDYIGMCLREMHAFAHDMNCHMQILAHPAKMDGERRKHPPELADISGSKHWDNMPDQGFTVHRKKLFEGGNRITEACLFHRKARFEELGYPCSLPLDFRVNEGRYVSLDYADPVAGLNNTRTVHAA